MHTPDRNYAIDDDNFQTPYHLNSKYTSLIKKTTGEENVKDTDMDDYDNNRVKKIRDYSFSPSKTPSKYARDALMLEKFRKHLKSKQDSPRFNPYDVEWDSNQYRYSKTKDFGYKERRRAESAIHYDIEGAGFRMTDQPNLEGLDQYITIWCSCDDDPEHKPYL